MAHVQLVSQTWKSSLEQMFSAGPQHRPPPRDFRIPLRATTGYMRSAAGRPLAGLKVRAVWLVDSSLRGANGDEAIHLVWRKRIAFA